MSLPQEMLLPTSAPSVSLFSFPTLQERLGLIKPTTLIPPRSLISLLIPVLFWLLLEVVFYALVRLYLYPRINQVRRPPANPLSPRECFQRVVNVTLAVKDVYSFESFLQGWFKGADFADIKRDNVKCFLAWAGWHRRYHQLNEKERGIVEDAIADMEKRHGTTFRPGFNPNIDHVSYNQEAVYWRHRPLAFYVLNKLSSWGGVVYLWLTGFVSFRTSQGIKYWFRPARTAPGQEEELPLMFFHGIAPGLWIYLPFLTRFGGQRACIYVEVEHITTTLSFEASRWNVMVQAVEEVMQRHGIQGMCVSGHSFGSIVAGWMAKALHDKVKQLVLIDPVCLLLCLPEVARNFLYRPPKCGILRPRDYLDPTHELTVATSMRREFWWYEKVLWAEDIKCPVVVALSGEDEIVPSHALKHYLTNHHLDCRVLFWPSLGHGQLLLRTEEQEELITAMREQAKRVPGTMGEEDDHNKLKMLQSPSSPSKRKGKKRKGGSSLASSPHGLAKPF